MSTGQEEHLDSKLENQISEEENQSQNQNFPTAIEDSIQASIEKLDEVDDEINPIEVKDEFPTTIGTTYDILHPREPSPKRIKLEETETEPDSNGIADNDQTMVVVPPKTTIILYPIENRISL